MSVRLLGPCLLVLGVACEDPVPMSLDPIIVRDGEEVTVRLHGPPGERFRVSHPDQRGAKAEGTFGAQGDAEVTLPLWRLHHDPVLEIVALDDRDDRTRQAVRFELDLAWNGDARCLKATHGGRIDLRADGLQIQFFPLGTEVALGEASTEVTSSETRLPLAPSTLLAAMDPAALRPGDREVRQLDLPLRVQQPDGQSWEGTLPYTGGAAQQVLAAWLGVARAGPVALPERTGDAVLAIGEAAAGATIHGAFETLSDLRTLAFVEKRRRRAGGCPYEGGVEVPIEVEDHTVTFVDPRTGETLESLPVPFTGRLRSCPISVPTATAGERVFFGGTSREALERLLEARAEGSPGPT